MAKLYLIFNTLAVCDVTHNFVRKVIFSLIAEKALVLFSKRVP